MPQIPAVFDLPGNKSYLYLKPEPRAIITVFYLFGQEVYFHELIEYETEIQVRTWPPGLCQAVVYAEGQPVGRTILVLL